MIWFRSLFPSLTDAGKTKPVFGVTRGIANANPQKPTIPQGAEELATAVVTSTDLATQTVVITQTSRLTAFAGGVVFLRNQADQNAWNPADGSVGFRIDRGTHVDRINGAWRLRDTGDTAITLNGGWTKFDKDDPTPTVRVVNGMASVNSRLSANIPGTTEAFTLPPGARPSQQRITTVMRGNTPETVRISADGKFDFLNLSLPATDYRLSTIPPWPVA